MDWASLPKRIQEHGLHDHEERLLVNGPVLRAQKK